jgi:hypothetical protein
MSDQANERGGKSTAPTTNVLITVSEPGIRLDPRKSVRPFKGIICDAISEFVGDSSGSDYRLQVHGRYSHAPAYVERLLAISGLQSKSARIRDSCDEISSALI